MNNSRGNWQTFLIKCGTFQRLCCVTRQSLWDQGPRSQKNYVKLNCWFTESHVKKFVKSELLNFLHFLERQENFLSAIFNFIFVKNVIEKFLFENKFQANAIEGFACKIIIYGSSMCFENFPLHSMRVTFRERLRRNNVLGVSLAISLPAPRFMLAKTVSSLTVGITEISSFCFWFK